jgi:hypothetical protein
LDISVFRYNKVLVSLLAFSLQFFLGSVQVYPQSEKAAPIAKPSVLIASLPVEGSRDEGVRKVLASAMRFQLEQMGTQTLLFASTDEEALVRDLFGEEERDPEFLIKSLMEFFSGVNHEFLALAGYIKEGEEIQVSFFIADLQRGEILASAAQRAPIDFTLDEAMIQALRDMLPEAAKRIEEVARRKAADAAHLAEEQQAAGESVARTGDKTTSDTVERFRPFEFSIGFAPFIPVSVANDVFSLSYAPFVYGSYRIPLSAGILGLGLYTGLNIFDSDEAGIASYFHYIVPIGIDVRFTTLEGTPIGLFVRASTGVAINVSDFSSLPAIAQEGLSRFLAYAAGGVGAMYAISRNVGIAFDVTYETFVYFWQSDSGGGIDTDWIMGFVPSVYLYTRL